MKFLWLLIFLYLISFPNFVFADSLSVNKRISDVLPQGFSGPIVVDKGGQVITSAWVRVESSTSCKLVSLEAKKNTATGSISTERRNRIFVALVRDAKEKYQKLDYVSAAANDLTVDEQLAVWTGLRERQEASEALVQMAVDKVMLFLDIECTGTNSRENVDAVRSLVTNRLRQPT